MIDGLGSAGYVAREVIGVEEIVDYTPLESPLELLTGKMGTAIGSGIADAIGLNKSVRQWVCIKGCMPSISLIKKGRRVILRPFFSPYFYWADSSAIG